jgi:hypothetical protein
MGKWISLWVRPGFLSSFLAVKGNLDRNANTCRAIGDRKNSREALGLLPFSLLREAIHDFNISNALMIDSGEGPALFSQSPLF